VEIGPGKRRWVGAKNPMRRRCPRRPGGRDAVNEGGGVGERDGAEGLHAGREEGVSQDAVMVMTPNTR